MHACGHDAHTAVLLAAAKALIEVKEELPGDVLIIHQYAEEIPPGGANDMIADGVLDNAGAVIGGHVWSLYDSGTIAVVPGLTMAGRAYFKAVITGKGGHGSQPHRCVDPIVAASGFVTTAQSVISRNVDPLESAVISFGRFEGLGTFNAIPDSVTLEGDVRSFSESSGKFIEARFKEMLAGICGAYGCSFELVYNHDYPPVNNDEELAKLAKKFINAGGVPGLKLRAGELTTGSEDFSYYQQKVPGLYVFFGAKPTGEVFSHHHPKFDIDESCMIYCAKFYAGFAVDYFEQNQK
jgi:amidohydrolase